MHGMIGFDFASHWLKNWGESFKPIIKRSNRNHIITFDSHLKTALISSFLLTRLFIGLYKKESVLSFCNNYYYFGLRTEQEEQCVRPSVVW